MNKLIIIMLLTLSSSVVANNENPHDKLTVTLEKIRIHNNIPAMAVAIISSGEVTYIKGFVFIDD